MFLSKVSINRPVMITMIIMVFVVFGLLAFFGLPINLMPKADLPFVTIQTIYPGAGPAEIETQISKKIEDAVSTISNINYIESYSMDNVSLVIMSFELTKDVDVATAEVTQKVDAIINELPEEIDKPTIGKYDMSAEPIIELVLSGTLSGLKLFEIADKELKDRFSQIEGVANVNISGGQKREIHVKFDDKVVFQNMISIPQFAQILAAHNMDMPGGQFQQKDQEYSVRLSGELDAVQELKELEIPTYFGKKKLNQLAEVTDAGEEIRKRSVYFNNQEKVSNDNIVRISIVKTSEGNPVDIARDVRKALSSIKNELPVGTELEIVDDSSRFIESSVSDTLNNVLLGIIFTGIVLLFFLHDLRSTLIVAIAMPTSIISTFMAMQWAGFSMNILSLMGLSTSVGILVTNSVVVLENIFRHKEMGHSRRVAADSGTAEITVAVVASTLTNIVVFLPLAMIQTIAGQFIREFALTVVFATVFSLLVSFTITPMMASLLIPEKKKVSKIGDKMEAMFHNWEKGYGKILAHFIKNKWRALGVVVISFVIFLGTMGFLGPRMGFEFMPMTDEGNIQIEFELPEGYNLAETGQIYQEIENRISQYNEVKHMLSTLGSQGFIDEGVNLASINVKLVDVEEREFSSEEMADKFIRDLSTIPNAKIKVQVSSSTGGGPGAAVEFYLQGQDMEMLKTLTNEFVEKTKTIPGLINYDNNLRTGKPEITLIPKREMLAANGLTIYDLALTLRTGIEGIVATQYREGGNEYDVKLSLKDTSVDTPDKIRNIPVITQAGAFRLSQLADIEFTKGSTKIVHRDKFKSIQFTAGVAIGYAQGDVVNGIRKIMNEFDLPEGYRFDWGGSSEMMEENNREMGKAFMIAILLTYMLLAAILESFTKPILILMTLPLALIGVMWIMYITGTIFSLVSMMAVIMLLGIVVNAAILLLDYTQMLREDGRSTHDALLEACPTKFKPILMSTIAIIMGMLPMAVGIGSAGAEMRQPLGIVSIGGLVVSTIMTLFMIPAFYYLTTHKFVKKVEKV
ncbi:MAG: efflux RND transporter permease subunit [Candidatus Cloacimonetes bacterium]|nr:efflux RND transporter permease subunit [Candidatus Cloacimonadota bacterium]MCF7814303.1 efflux RND transporter permease subunit [Candidatus Cloacimonadota bacterium]MCF7868380.1 efflux RND transporter permease subunit [Candidatus Cloacimonadota bacterium]MCF7883855.1 efflux RND transporter permease subunit [Candidatus Cloacimonadota bacterium]